MYFHRTVTAPVVIIAKGSFSLEIGIYSKNCFGDANIILPLLCASLDKPVVGSNILALTLISDSK